MMNKNTKKERERFYLEKFLAAADWNAHIIRDGKDDGNDPDFFITFDGAEVGIEMTQLLKDRKRLSGKENVMAIKEGFYDNRLRKPGEYFQLKDDKHFSENWMRRAIPGSIKPVSHAMASESRHNKFLRLLAKEYYKIGGCPIMLELSLNNPNEFELNSRIPEFAILIKEKADLLSQNGKIEFEIDDEVKAWVDRHPNNNKFKEYNRWKVINDSVGLNKLVDVQMLEDLLLPKYEKFEKYKKTVGRVIALIYADLNKSSGFMRIEGLAPKVKLGGFEAIYLYLHGDSPKSSYWSIGY